MKKILITGASGMLGRYVTELLYEARYEVVAPKRAEFDLASREECYRRILEIRPSAILHLAAETDVDLCERDPRHAARLNTRATEAIAHAANEIGAWIVYVSTSNVFGAEHKMIYNEIDLPGPVNYYGRSKLFGEQAIKKYCPVNSLVIRAGWMIGGGSAGDHKFVGKIIHQIREGAQSLRAVGDRFGTITPAPVLAKFICNSLAINRCGLFHFASKGVVTRLDIAREIASYFSYKGPVQAVSSPMFPLSAPRPYFEGIESIFLDDEQVDPPKYWRDDLVDYLHQFSI